MQSYFSLLLLAQIAHCSPPDKWRRWLWLLLTRLWYLRHLRLRWRESHTPAECCHLALVLSIGQFSLLVGIVAKLALERRIADADLLLCDRRLDRLQSVS